MLYYPYLTQRGAPPTERVRLLYRTILRLHPVGCGLFYKNGGNAMQTRVAVMAIIVEKGDAVERLNAVLHEYGEHIIGRMGIPYRKRA